MSAKLLHFPKPDSLPFQFPESVKDEGWVIKTVPLGVGSRALPISSFPRKPLRKVVFAARREVRYRAWGLSNVFHSYFIDTLVCGHTIHTYTHEQLLKRRGCQECLEASLAERLAA